MNRVSIVVLALASSLLAAACGHASSSSSSPTVRTHAEPAPSVQSSSTSAYDDCVAMLTRSRQCSDDYLRGLVDLRVRLDHPAGIAQADRDQGREALVQQGLAEWAVDSTDEHIAETCRHAADTIDPDLANRGHALIQQCLAEDACPAFVTCEMPLFEERMKN